MENSSIRKRYQLINNVSRPIAPRHSWFSHDVALESTDIHVTVSAVKPRYDIRYISFERESIGIHKAMRMTREGTL